MKRRKVLVITGARAEYDILFPVMKAINEHPRLQLGVVVTGAHLSKKYGYTLKNIERDGFPIEAKIKNFRSSQRDVDRVKGLAIQLFGLCKIFAKRTPDFLLVAGDREEAMNAGLLGQYMNIAVAHISGGDRAVGNADDQVRHAVTKLAHVHFATNVKSAERISKMGEQKFRIFNVGNPGLDRLRDVPKIPKRTLLKYYGFGERDVNEPLLLVIQHPLSTEIDSSYSHIKKTMEAIKSLKINTIVNYPNSDPGSQAIVRCIEEYKNVPFIKIVRNIPRPEFVNVLRCIDCLIGNSSAGILEAPFLGLPVINVGNRQKKRMHAENVQFVPHNTIQILSAVSKAVFDERYRAFIRKCSNPYGGGHSGKRIAHILATITIDKKLLIKDLTY